ncbi:MAG: tRNA uridine-5-carboxymethylaminomethyl(34) synthesis enzyme MnmG [Clostridia bacterium]|nr:tRNA uridine-5-carboxymethylaminomethyl(34) synthesis enzyme MnmG [Clostridia bacterium]
MGFVNNNYDVVVVGAGHAGCEAALASARMGCKTLVITLNLDNVALMPCNPSVGGPAKGHLVREIDALGGEMGYNIDKTLIQIRMLNTGKGPAVHALRAQADKKGYQQEMTLALEKQNNLDVKQALVEELIVEDNVIKGVVTTTGATYFCHAVIITSGTYLKGKIILGDVTYPGGPNGQLAAANLGDSLRKLGLELGRFKTGTPPRIDSRTVDYKRTTIQPGDEGGLRFSFWHERPEKEQVPCWLTYTTERTHRIIRDNLHRSPLYGGLIEGTGPRYCPSIEDKVVRFADKNSHQIFLEPEGLNTYEMYVQGFSTSLPEDVQWEMLRSVIGLEEAEIMRPGYAIEYDYLNPTQLTLSLETKTIRGLFTAGQFNGTSGYEEAAAQGLMAGINAALKVGNKQPLILKRSESYIGVLIDDLVTKGTNEPYRMLTSRAEYRLLLRQDNADLRLSQYGYDCGLLPQEKHLLFSEKRQLIEEEKARLSKLIISSSSKQAANVLAAKGSSEIKQGVAALDLLRRPELTYDDIYAMSDENQPNLPKAVTEQVEIQLKFEGYIKKQLDQVEKFNRLEQKFIPTWVDYWKISGLSIEGQQKLAKVTPNSIGQASRISGVSPADLSVLLVYLEQQRRMGENR